MLYGLQIPHGLKPSLITWLLVLFVNWSLLLVGTFRSFQLSLTFFCKNSFTKTVDQLAREVIYGYWGNGQERKNRLTAAGYDYSAVQKRVNELMWK